VLQLNVRLRETSSVAASSAYRSEIGFGVDVLVGSK
jgi:hypothetical protein